MNKLSDALRKLAVSIKSFGKVFQGTLCELSQENNDDFLIITNYKCNKCDGFLSIKEHSTNYILYECMNCGKRYKARKSYIYGRFKL